MRRLRGFSLLETLVAMSLVAIAMTGLLVAFVGSSKFGVLARRQATALAIARSVAGQLDHVPWTDTRIVNTNVNNDATFADPNGLFAYPTLPTGNDAPDITLPVQTLGDEQYEVYVNVATDPAGPGRLLAVIVRYHVGRTNGTDATGKWMRAVALGFHYDPAAVRLPAVPLPI